MSINMLVDHSAKVERREHKIERRQSEQLLRQQTNMTVAGLSPTSDADGSSGGGASAGNIYFCYLCNKPITNESAFKRHLTYCRRTIGQPKKRQRSCKQCHHSKAKCSFQSQCSRCTVKGFTCEYERTSASSASNEATKDGQDALTPEHSGSSPSDGTTSPSQEFAIFTGPENAQTIAELHTHPPPRFVTELRTDPKHNTSALFLLDTLRGLPYLMSRRETLPFFIHGQWHVPELPQIYANGVRIAQLYITRDASPGGRELLNTTMKEERQRLIHKVSTVTGDDLVARLAMQSLYTVMTAFEDEVPQSNNVPELEAQEPCLQYVSKTARQCFASDKYTPFDIDTIGDPNENWEEFIYAESRRRCALFWFIVSRVIDLKHGARCPPVMRYRGLSLPSPGALWSARTKEEWEQARAELRERHREPLNNTTLRTLGDLIDSRAAPSTHPEHMIQVSNWLAGCDNLGLLVMIASTMI